MQDQKAYFDYQQAIAAKRFWRACNPVAKETQPRLKKLQREISAKQDYANRWYRGIKTKTGRIQDIAFECEATLNEIKAVKIIGGSPDIMKASGYLKLCPEAQRQIIRWQDELRAKRR